MKKRLTAAFVIAAYELALICPAFADTSGDTLITADEGIYVSVTDSGGNELSPSERGGFYLKISIAEEARKSHIAVGISVLSEEGEISYDEWSAQELPEEMVNYIGSEDTIKQIRISFPETSLYADAYQAQRVVDAIDSLGEVTLDKRVEIEETDNLYYKLSRRQKLYVYNYDTLCRAQERYKELDAERSETAKTVMAVIEKIIAIGEVSVDSGEAIAAAREAYEALTPERKEMVINYSSLTDAEGRYAYLIERRGEDLAEAEKVAAMIDALGEITLRSGSAVNAARDEYELLSGEQKELVRNYDALVQAEACYEELVQKNLDDRNAAAGTVKMIMELGAITLDSGDAIKAARESYDALEPSQQSMVTNYRTLTRAEEKYEKLLQEKDKQDRQAAAEVIVLINAIGEVGAESGEAISAARNAYELLNDDAKEYVIVYYLLEEAEEEYARQSAEQNVSLMEDDTGGDVWEGRDFFRAYYTENEETAAYACVSFSTTEDGVYDAYMAGYDTDGRPDDLRRRRVKTAAAELKWASLDRKNDGALKALLWEASEMLPASDAREIGG